MCDDGVVVNDEIPLLKIRSRLPWLVNPVVELNWTFRMIIVRPLFVFVSPALAFGAFAPGERLGEYRLGDDVAVAPEDGGAISSADYALGLVDLIERDDLRRAHVNLAH